MNFLQMKKYYLLTKKSDRTSYVYLFSFRRGFSKKTAIQEEGKKQIEALEKHRKQLLKDNNGKESSTHSKQKENFEKLANKRMEEIQDLSKQIDFNNLTYCYNGNTAPKSFYRFKGSTRFL